MMAAGKSKQVTVSTFISAPVKSAISRPWMMAVTIPTATPAPGPNAKPETMAGMFEASNLSQVTPGSKGNSMNERRTPMAHMRAMVTSCLVDHALVFLVGVFRVDKVSLLSLPSGL